MNTIYESSHPLVAHKLTRLRDKTTDPKKFRELVREISALLAYEATADLEIAPLTVETPLAKADGMELKQPIGLVPILRAGLGMVEGLWGLMPTAEVWHIGLYRDERTLQPVEYYNKLPISPTVQVCLVLDPMLATGGSAVATIDILIKGCEGSMIDLASFAVDVPSVDQRQLPCEHCLGRGLGAPGRGIGSGRAHRVGAR